MKYALKEILKQVFVSYQWC